MLLPRLYSSTVYRTETQTFFGLDRRVKAPDGTFCAMKNISGDDYPVLTERKKRGTVTTLTTPQGIAAKESLAYVDGGTLYYNGVEITGVTLSNTEKRMLSMGAYLLIWPDLYYLNTADLTDKGYMYANISVDTSVNPITYTLTTEDGSDYADPYSSAFPPANPENGDVWIDTSGEMHILKKYNEDTGAWVSIATTYVKISAPGIGAGLRKYDGIDISGLNYPAEDNPSISAQINALNGTVIAYDVGTDYIVVTGILDQTVQQETGSVAVSRTVPDMDYVTEAENRIWGCKYGIVDGKPVNEIYCCALGDFRNWRQYMGLSTDSWAASQGSDGAFTGAITHLGHPIFFKENCLHKVTISPVGAHSVSTTICRGVQLGSEKSLVVVNEYLYYKSRTDVCVYDGSLPQSVSEPISDTKYYSAVAGAYAGKYYISMRDIDNVWHLLVYDTDTHLWYEEDNLHAMQFAQMEDDLYCIDVDTGKILALMGTAGTIENGFEWEAESSVIGYENEDQTRVSRFLIRADVPNGSYLDVFVQYDSNGFWQHIYHVAGGGIDSSMIPIVARRCDHMQIKFKGYGSFKLYSFVKRLAIAGDRRFRR